MSDHKNLFEAFPSVSTREWEAIIERDLNGADYKEQLRWHTGEGIKAQPFYRREDRLEADTAVVSTNHSWRICQLINVQDVEQANKAAKRAIEGGAEALRFESTVETASEQETPNVKGVPVQSQHDFERMLQGLGLKDIELQFDAGVNAPVIVALLLNTCDQRGIDTECLQGSVGVDLFSQMLKQGQMPEHRDTLQVKVEQLIAVHSQQLPGMRTLRVDSAALANMGATIVEQLAYAMAAGSEYMAMVGKWAASAIYFTTAVSGSYFLEISKLRAARKLWDQVLEVYEVDEEPMQLHAETATWNKAFTEPHTNIIRETTEAMAGVIGGSDTITVCPFDETGQTADEFANRIARNTLLVLREEAHFDKVNDPAAGAWYIETLTDKIAEAAWKEFQQIEQQGGLFESIKTGAFQSTINKSRQQRAEEVSDKKRVFVGVNKYIKDEEGADAEVHSSGVMMNQTGEDAEIDKSNLIPSIKKALNSGAVVGDVAPALLNDEKVEVEPIAEYHID